MNAGTVAIIAAAIHLSFLAVFITLLLLGSPTVASLILVSLGFVWTHFNFTWLMAELFEKQHDTN